MISYTEDVLFILGILILAGYLSLLIFRKIKVPNVVAFLIAGFVLSNWVIHSLTAEAELWFVYSENAALGLIGFAIGTELKLKTLLENKKILSVLLIAEAFGAFLVVYFFTLVFFKDPLMSLILGGIATATAPAATIEMIRKNRAAGEVTTLLQWLLAFDDLLAIFVVEGILAYLIVVVQGTFNISSYFSALSHELGLAIAIGLMSGFILNTIIEKLLTDELEMMEFTFAILLFVIGLSEFLQTSSIVSTMTVGAVVTNTGGDNFKNAKDLLEVLMAPITAFFFILVGARIEYSSILSISFLPVLYLFGRSFGKIIGSYLGTSTLGMDRKVKNNLGFGLLAQGGVALGMISKVLEVLESTKNEAYIAKGLLIYSAVIISTVFSEFLGAYGTQFALQRAEEAGKGEPLTTNRQTFMHE